MYSCDSNFFFMVGTAPNHSSLEQTRREIMEGDKLGRQGDRGSQEIMKGDKLGRQGGSQEQPRREIVKRDKLGR